jgi:hypothetical protein
MDIAFLNQISRYLAMKKDTVSSVTTRHNKNRQQLTPRLFGTSYRYPDNKTDTFYEPSI